MNGKLLLVLIGSVLCFAPVRAQSVPDPANSTVSPADTFGGVVVCPDKLNQIPAAIETITVRNAANNPIPNIQVRLCICTAPPLMYCQGQGPCWYGTTNAVGQVQLSLGAGGCCIQPNAAKVEWHDGSTWNNLLRTYPWVKSPDYDGIGPNLVVDAVDYTYHWPPGAPCADFGMAPLVNRSIFGSAFTGGNHCSP